jgi:hypothetical protein
MAIGGSKPWIATASCSRVVVDTTRSQAGRRVVGPYVVVSCEGISHRHRGPRGVIALGVARKAGAAEQLEAEPARLRFA